MSTEDEMMTIAEVCRFLGGKEKPLDKSTVYRWVRLGRLPQPVGLGGHLARWKRSEIIAARDALPRRRA